MEGNIYLFIPVLLPAAFGLCLKWLKAPEKRAADINVAAMFLCALASLAALFAASDTRLTLWRITDSISVSFSLDGLGRFYLCFVTFTWTGVGLYAREYLEHDIKAGRFWRYYLISYAALMGLCMADNLITLYMFYECMTLATLPLVAHNMDKQAVAAAIKYLIYSVFGASLALLGVFFIGSYAGGFDFRAGGILEGFAGNRDAARVFIFIMIIGFSVKAGMFPLHSWLPTAHPVAPAPASAVLSGVITKMGVLGIIRTVFYISGVELLRGTWAQYAFMTLSLITVVMGSMLAYREKSLKKRLAYSTVSQVSYVLFGLSTLTEIGFVGACLHILFHSLIKNTLFMSAGAFIHKTEKTEVADLRGAGKVLPVTMTLFTLVSLGLIGLPPTGGFVSKWNLAQGALSMNISANWIGPAALLLSAILTAAYLLSISIRAFFPGDDFAPQAKNEVGLRMLIPMGAMAALTFILGMFPNGLIRFFEGIAASLM